MNAFLKQKSFRFDFKISMFSDIRIEFGRLFHNVGPHTLKLFDANVLFDTLGTINSLYLSSDLRPFTTLLQHSRFVK